MLSPFTHDLLVVFSSLFWIIHPAVVFGLVVRVIMRRPPTGVALAWMLLIASAPIVGAVIYLLIGERRLGRNRLRNRETLRSGFQRILSEQISTLGDTTESAALPAPLQSLDSIGRSYGGFPTAAGNRHQLLHATDEIFDAIVADIDSANVSVLMEFYIWNSGGRADDVLSALISAAKRGVRCYVLIDALGARPWWKTDQPARLREAGVKLLSALPPGLMTTLFGRNDLRLHRKIIVVDSHIAWTGSMNLVDPRFFKQDSGVGCWVDAMVRLQGPVCIPLALTMLGDWVIECGDSVISVLAETRITMPNFQGKTSIQVVPSGPGDHDNSQLQMTLAMIDSAEKEVILTTPYFVPPDPLLLGLQRARARGVSVRLVVPERVDSLLTRYASRSYFSDLLEAGIDVFLYQGGLLHTKSVTVDQRVSMFGTVNLDIRSLALNYEVALYVYDGDYTENLVDLQQSYISDSKLLEVREWDKRTVLNRFCENALRLASPLL